MKLLISLPAYNEEKTIAFVIKSIPVNINGIDEINILVFDDGSTDKTRELAESSGATAIGNSENKGLSRVFQEIVEKALEQNVDVLVNIDADGQFNGRDVPKLLEPILKNRADCVTASRFINKELIPQMPKFKKWGNEKVARLISFVARKRLYDVSCGFRAYSKEALLNLNLFSKFTYTHESLLNLIFKGLRIVEVPVRVKGEREFGNSKVAHNLWRYGYNIFNTIFRTMLDYKPLKFFGWSGIILFIIGFLLDLFVLIRLLAIGEITPYKSVGFGGLALNIFGLLLFIIGLIADMINRVRMTQERILYYEKKGLFKNK